MIRPPAEIVQLRQQSDVLPTGWGRSKRKLATVGDCRQEAARVYHLTASGRIAPEDLSRAVYALSQISKMAEVEMLEDRIAQLEAMLMQAAPK